MPHNANLKIDEALHHNDDQSVQTPNQNTGQNTGQAIDQAIDEAAAQLINEISLEQAAPSQIPTQMPPIAQTQEFTPETPKVLAQQAALTQAFAEQPPAQAQPQTGPAAQPPVQTVPQTAPQTTPQAAMPANPTTGEVQTQIQRRELRKRVLKAGYITFGDAMIRYECVVRDMSTSGARIVLSEMVSIPEHFTLHIRVDGIKVNCHRAWQKGTQCGMYFTGEPEKTFRASDQKLQSSENAFSAQTRQRMEHNARRAEDHASMPEQKQSNASLINNFRRRSTD